jgi:predicted negative regulator of RcsB-dependent stress response
MTHTIKPFTLPLLLVLGLLAAAVPARAQDVIYPREGKKNITGIITAESAKGVKLKGREQLVPAQGIRDIEYDVSTIKGPKGKSFRLEMYLPAVGKEKKALEAPKGQRLKLLDDAIRAYQDLVPVMGSRPFARTQVEYRIAHLYTLKGEWEGTETGRLDAIKKLKEFKTRHPDTWQTGQVLETLAGLQVEQKDYDEAEQTLRALAAAPVSEDVRQEAELKIARLPLAAGNYAEAEKKLADLAGRLPKGSPYGQRALLGQAEALTAQKKIPAARELLQKLVGEASDKETKALAYNTLGYCHLQGGQLKEAQWAFLWVTMMYNQNKEEDAKALYYLHQVFSRLNEGEHAQECLETLLHDPRYAGLEYQRKAQEEREKEKGG